MSQPLSATRGKLWSNDTVNYYYYLWKKCVHSIHFRYGDWRMHLYSRFLGHKVLLRLGGHVKKPQRFEKCDTNRRQVYLLMSEFGKRDTEMIVLLIFLFNMLLSLQQSRSVAEVILETHVGQQLVSSMQSTQIRQRYDIRCHNKSVVTQGATPPACIMHR